MSAVPVNDANRAQPKKYTTEKDRPLVLRFWIKGEKNI
jgi:hypothetical protein